MSYNIVVRKLVFWLLILVNISFSEAIIKSNYPLAKNNFSKVITKNNLQRVIGIIKNISYIKDVKVLGFKHEKPILYIERYPIIRSVHIKGNHFFNNYELIPIANIRPGTPVKSSLYGKQKSIKEFLEEFYKNNGFLKAKIQDKITQTKNGYLNVYIDIKEGDLYFIKNVYINGKKFEDEHIPIGEIADVKNINRIFELVRNHYKKAFVYQKSLKIFTEKKPFLSIFGAQKVKYNIFHIVGVFVNDISKFLEYPIAFTKTAIGEGGVVDIYYEIYKQPNQELFFQGNKHFNDKLLKKVANIDEIDISTLQKAKKRLERFYKNLGYFDVKISYKPNKDYTKAIFNIDEGKRYTLRDINSNCKELEAFIKKRYKTKEIDLNTIKKIVEDFHRKLKQEGYIYGYHRYIRIQKNNDYTANIYIDQDKGYKITISKILVKGTKNKHILKIFKSYNTPREYKAKDIEDMTKYAANEAKRYGYFDVSITPKANVKVLRKHYYSYIYTFYVSLSKRYKNTNTVIYGYNHTLEHSIQYMASVSRYYSSKDENESLRNLQESGIFNAVNLETFTNKKDKTVDRLIEVQEGKRGFFRLKAGYNTQQRLVLDSTVGWSDLFGTPAQAIFNYDISNLNTTYKLGMTDKFLFSNKYFGSMFYERDFEIHNSYYLVSKGINLTLGRRFLEDYKFSIGYSKTRNYVYNAPTQDNGYSDQETVSLALIRNYKNNPTNPTKLGYDYLAFTKSLQTGYNSINLNTYYLMHIVDKIFYSFKFGFGAENDGLIYQRFFLGGLKDMMGYNFEDIGSPEGGKYYGFLRNEIDFPIKKPFNLTIFSDIGNVSDSISSLGSHIKKDVGIGVFVYTPVGPVRFDVAKPLSQIPNVQSSIKYYISIGYFY